MTADVLVMALAFVLGASPSNHFSEQGFVTYFSFLQLAVIAWLSLKVFMVRQGAAIKGPWKTKSFVWFIIAAAFVYLAVDETCSLHAGIDLFIHYIFGMQETALTDRIDDILIGCYGLIGLIVLYYYRGEMFNYKRMFPFFIAGYTLLFIMVALDIVSNRDDLLSLVIGDSSRLNTVFLRVRIFEDMLKVIAEGIFVVAFYGCLKIAREGMTEGGRMADCA